MKEGGIYIHIPFCRSKCLYCDFYSGGQRIADWDAYILSMINELKTRESELNFQPVTLYIGGGTPSLMPLNKLETLVNLINRTTGSEYRKEFTLEVNPEDVTKESCELWHNLGVTRISIGIQSFNDHELKIIGRRHDAMAAIKSLELLKDRFENISADLMFGLPGQSIESYARSLDTLISLAPVHISSYSLMLEPGTAMTLLEEKGKIVLPVEDDWIEMFRMTTEKLVNAGYRRYEISNYSLPGYESMHNSNYWRGNPYLGLGPGAHSYDGDKIRRANPQDIKGYLRYFADRERKKRVFYQEEILNDEERREEMIMTRLRTIEGLNLENYATNFGTNKCNDLIKRASNYIKRGLLKEEGNNISFTGKGFLIMNQILVKLIE